MNSSEPKFSRNQYYRAKDGSFLRPIRRSYKERTSFRGKFPKVYVSNYHSQYSSSRYGHWEKRRKQPPIELPERKQPQKLVEGTEEYMMQKIQQTSAIIMRKLLTPEEDNNITENVINMQETEDASANSLSKTKRKICKRNPKETQNNVPDSQNHNSVNSESAKSYDIQAIQNEIMKHIMNLNDGKKKNLINVSSSGYDEAIQQIQKQRRLEISRALRNMCCATSNTETEESSNLINSIFPDMGIKVEDLPIDVIQELRVTLGLDTDDDFTENECVPAEKHGDLCTQIKVEIEIDPSNLAEDEKQEDLIASTETSTNNEAAQNLLAESSCSREIKQELLNSIEDSSSNMMDTEKESLKETDRSEDTSQELLDNKPNIIEIFKEDICDNDVESSNKRNMESDKNILIANNVSNANKFCQTDVVECNVDNFFQHFTQYFSNCDRNNFGEVIDKMYFVDGCISKLTKYRQELFQTMHENSRKTIIAHDNDFKQIRSNEEIQDHDVKHPKFEHVLKYPVIQEKVVVLKLLNTQMLIATEKGNILYYSLETEKVICTLELTSGPITCLLFDRHIDSNNMYVGSSENYLKVINFFTKELVKTIYVEDKVQCVDAKWSYIFIGGLQGNILRYSIKNEKVEFEDKSCKSIQAIKAAQEGPRPVLLIGSRDAPVVVKDAMSGLFLRSFASNVTVYSLLLENQTVYCGTTQNGLLIFDFYTGETIETSNSPETKSITCVKIYKNLLFTGCSNGLIYVHDAKTKKYIDALKGPGGSILCMEIFSNQIAVGTITCQFAGINIPKHIFHVM